MTRETLSRNVQVLVVGAGPAGLVAAATLARYGVEVLLIDKRRPGSSLSRSLVVSTRGMELMRRLGIEEAVRAGASDVTIGAWVTPTLAAGTGTALPLGFPSDAECALLSPSRPAWVAQDHCEPLLLELVSRQRTVAVQFELALQGLHEEGSVVRASLVDARSGAVSTVDASYVIGADGAHSAVRRALGARMTGPDDLGDYERVEFIAPLWPVVGENRYGLYLIQTPDASGVLAPRGRGDRWGFSREVPVGSRGLVDLSPQEQIALLRRAIGRDDVHPVLERITTWTFAAQLADRYRQGRSFLVGDAAHRMTPRGGTGMNTAIQDGFDLAWKVAWVLRGWADPELLASYELERRPVAEHNASRAAAADGANAPTEAALPWDLNGRVPHAWVDAARRLSTIDVVSDGLTLFVGVDHHAWHGVARTHRAPTTVTVVGVHVLTALGVPPTGGLLVRPDGREVMRWAAPPGAADGVAVLAGVGQVP